MPVAVWDHCWVKKVEVMEDGKEEVNLKFEVDRCQVIGRQVHLSLMPVACFAVHG